MPISPFVAHIEEPTGEAADPAEENLAILFDKTALPGADIHAPFTGKAFIEYGFFVLGATGGDVDVDLQEWTGESDDPNETNLAVIIPKTLAPGYAKGQDKDGFTTGSALILPLE